MPLPPVEDATPGNDESLYCRPAPARAADKTAEWTNQSLLPKVFHPWINDGIWSKVMLVVRESHGLERPRPQLDQSAMQLFGGEVEFGIRRVAQAEDAEPQRSQ